MVSPEGVTATSPPNLVQEDLTIQPDDHQFIKQQIVETYDSLKHGSRPDWYTIVEKGIALPGHVPETLAGYVGEAYTNAGLKLAAGYQAGSIAVDLWLSNSRTHNQVDLIRKPAACQGAPYQEKFSIHRNGAPQPAFLRFSDVCTLMDATLADNTHPLFERTHPRHGQPFNILAQTMADVLRTRASEISSKRTFTTATPLFSGMPDWDNNTIFESGAHLTVDQTSARGQESNVYTLSLVAATELAEGRVHTIFSYNFRNGIRQKHLQRGGSNTDARATISLASDTVSMSRLQELSRSSFANLEGLACANRSLHMLRSRLDLPANALA